MIITCDKCSTSFNLDDSLVNEAGSKVRCSVCKEIFTAYPLALESEPEPVASSGLDLEPDTDDGGVLEEPSEFEMDDSDFSFEEDADPVAESSDLEMDKPGLDVDEPDLDMDQAGLGPEKTDLEIDDDFSFEEDELEIDDDDESQKLELEENHLEFDDDDIEFGDVSLEDTGGDVGEEDLDEIEFEPIEDDEPVPLEIEEDDLSLKMEEETDSKSPDENLVDDSLEDDDEFELEFDVEDNSENEIPDIDDDISDEIPLEIETESEKEEVGLSLEDSKIEEVAEEPPIISPEEDFSEYDTVLEQETEPEEDSLEEETIEIDEPQAEALVEKSEPESMGVSPRSRRRKKKPLVGAPVLVMLLIFLLVIGAYIASIMTGYNIPYLSDIKIPIIEQYLKKPAPETSAAKPVPNQKSVNGRFVTNSSAGALFIITGWVENSSKIAYSYIEIKGALITKGKEEAKTKNAFCGNIITEEMLKTGNISDINKLLSVKAGNHNANVNIKPGASVPFMVVFSDLPDKLQNFTVKVLRFEKAKK
ncbi:MAG: hypothetical protein DRH93_19095 [Deltaproteobacteria bacterium]|nr:MAG: hypothetical protein DRH93_19095 [Deltaproteobacteria bacterium]